MRCRILFNLSLIAGSLIVAAALVELGLRLAGLSFPNFGTPDLVRGWSLRPGAEGWVRSENKSGVYVRINSDGLRDREHSLQKPPSTLRIAVLGDSYAEAFQVPLEASFWAVMERHVSQCKIPGIDHVEAINFGVAGYGTGQEMQTLREKVWKYHPDIVLLAVTTGNDIQDNFRALSQQPLSPYFVYQNGKLVLDDSFRSLIRFSKLRELEVALAKRSRLVQLVYAAYEGVKEIRTARRRKQSEATEAGLDDMIYVPPRSPDWREAWRVTEGIIRMMDEEVRQHGATLWITTLSNGIQVHPDRATRRAVEQRLGIDSLFYPDFRIRDFAAQEHIPAITPVVAMAEYAEKNRVFLHGFQDHPGQGHWNENGHRLAGEIIAGRLCSVLKGYTQ